MIGFHPFLEDHISPIVRQRICYELLAKYPDKVFSKQNLYESIWQEPFARDNDVINTHISNLRKKLKGEGCRIKTIWGLGYRFAK
jgi:DNA-binding response OmpR family regulator